MNVYFTHYYFLILTLRNLIKKKKNAETIFFCNSLIFNFLKLKKKEIKNEIVQLISHRVDKSF